MVVAWLCLDVPVGNSLMTLNSRLATAAAAMVHKMINRNRPLVFRPVSPFKIGSKEVAAIAKGFKDSALELSLKLSCLLRVP